MANSIQAAIVGASSLLGRELQDLIRDEKLPWTVRLLSSEAAATGSFMADGDEAAYVEPVTAEAVEGSDVIFLAAGAEAVAAALELDPEGRFVDLAGLLPDAPPLAAPRIGVDPEGSRIRIAHPAAIAMALLASKLAKAGKVERTIATVFEPASERGQQGIAELQKQSSALLSFQPLPKEVFDAQLAYNLLPEFGEDAPLSLASVEDRIAADLNSLLPGKAISLRLVQAPVFHGYSVLTWVRFAAPVEKLESAFAGDSLIDFRGEGVEPPTNSGAAQQDGFQIGSLRRDRADANAWWIWMTFDNLRTLASNAISAAQQIL